ncbi:MAG: DUF1573 domain-containing protein [Candidatus Aminicenantales bacterium]
MERLTWGKCVAGFIGSLIFLLVLGNFALERKAPKITFREESWNFRSVKKGEELKHEFIFKNDGEAMLTIKNVETSCGCTAALVSDKKIEPGKEGRIQIVFNTREYAGEVTKYIFVDSNDPKRPRVQLQITASIDVPPQPRIELDRFTYDAGLIVEGEDLEVRFTIKNRGELELKLECSLQNASFYFQGRPVSFPLKIASGKEAEILVKLAIPGRIGLVREFIVVKSNDTLRSTMSINVNGYIVTKEQLKKLFQKYKDMNG